MNNGQENKFNMYYSVQRTCNKYPSVWSATPGFVNGFSTFEDQIAAIETALGKQLKKSTGVTLDKKAVEAMLIDKVLIISGAGYAYASETKNFTLKQTFDQNKSGLSQLRDAVMMQICEEILTAARGVIGNLSDYGLVPADLTELDDLLESFSEKIVAPREVISERKSATAELESLFEICDEILKEKLDKMARRFSNSNAEFYSFYFNSRIIVDLGKRHESENEGENPAVA